MLKKMTVLAMALGVVAAMVLPTTASAVWKHGHSTPIQQDVQIGLTGQALFQSEAGGINCQVTSRVKFLTGQTTGEVETFVPHPTSATANCVGTGGLSQCEVEQVQPTNTPWILHTTGTAQAPDIQVTFGDIHGELKRKNLFCLFDHSTVTAGNATFQPTQTGGLTNGLTVHSLHLSGSTQGHLYSTPLPSQSVSTPTLTLGGTLTVEAPNTDTYSI